MFLRSLSVRGFKSFADKTVLEFAPGVSAVVGPNGSGKSNIVDAITWVLGEQGARALRGAERADVIFAGSPARPQLGMAEARLVIDNSAGLIKVPASEIEISRTLFRSGESEYRIGGRPCRLLDIQELLSDAGLGRALHAIVGQGRLDEVLQARPEDRRQFIEEAAGVAKHRRRRERAERKLAGLEQDLLRLQDVVNELRRQLRPLEKQAELAARHEELSREADEIAAKLAAVRLRELHRDRDRRRPSWAEAEGRQRAARERLDALGERLEGLERRRAEAEAAEREAEARHAAAQAARSRAEAELREAIRRESDARARMAAATNSAGRLFAVRDELERSERALEEVRASLVARERELEEAEREFRRLDQARRDAEEERRRVEGRTAAARAEAETVRRALALQEAEQEHMAQVLGELDERIARAAARADDLEAEVERADAQAAPFVEEQAALDRRRAELASSLAGLESSEGRLVARQEVVESRRAELVESPGAAFARAQGARALGVLRTLIAAPADLEVALRAALGAFADAVVYETRDRAIAAAAEEAAGTGLLLAPAEGGPERSPVPGERCLLDLVEPEPRVRGLAGSLLADVCLAETLEEAAAGHERHPGAQFVTREGIVVGDLFVRTPARIDQRMEKLRRESASLERELSAVRAGLREARRERGETEARLEIVRREIEESDRGITAAAEEMAGLGAELASLRRERDLVAERLRGVLGTATAARARLESWPGDEPALPDLPSRPEPPVHLRVEVEALRRERSRLEAGVARARREADALSAEDPVALRRLLSEAEAARAAAEAGLAEAEAAGVVEASAFQVATDAARSVRDEDAELNRAWREGSAELERLRAAHEDEDRARLDLERRIVDGERLLREGHGREPAEAVAALAEDDAVEPLQRRAELIARRLELVGRVNLLAADELGSLRERHDFMTRELEDVRAARRDLLEVIAEVDRQMAEMFLSAFGDVAREFAELFGELFPGGEGRLLLEDPADVLGSGIEIEARPGRKRVRRLSLLSGGERAMAAVAFLFAIFKARPSPFYVMDEVEAALDDVNLHRFIRALGGLAGRSQVLIVTHQKRTMEVADALYGVSMGRDGTSKVVSERLGDGRRVDLTRAEHEAIEGEVPGAGRVEAAPVE